MIWDIIGLGGLDWVDVPGLVYLEVYLLDVLPVLLIKVFFENIMTFFEDVFPKFSGFLIDLFWSNVVHKLQSKLRMYWLMVGAVKVE